MSGAERGPGRPGRGAGREEGGSKAVDAAGETEDRAGPLWSGFSLLVWERSGSKERRVPRMGPRTSTSPTEHKGPVQVTQVEEDKVMVLMDGKGPLSPGPRLVCSSH